MIDETTLRAALSEPTAWPNLSEAAGITGLSKGTLSKQAQAGNFASQVLGFGRGERVLPPDEVLRIGERYHRISRAILIQRLARFLSTRLDIDPGVAQRAVWALVDTETRKRIETSCADLDARNATLDPGDDPGIPNWLLEVERLRADPTTLSGTMFFTSPDDLIGTIDLGPSIDEQVEPGSEARKTMW